MRHNEILEWYGPQLVRRERDHRLMTTTVDGLGKYDNALRNRMFWPDKVIDVNCLGVVLEYQQRPNGGPQLYRWALAIIGGTSTQVLEPQELRLKIDPTDQEGVLLLVVGSVNEIYARLSRRLRNNHNVNGKGRAANQTSGSRRRECLQNVYAIIDLRFSPLISDLLFPVNT